MNYYRTSNGDKVSKSEIDRRVRKAKKEKISDQLNEYGYNFCEKSIMHNVEIDDLEYRILDCAHIISVNECQRTKRTELAWDKDNIMIICRHCHRIYDKTNLKFKSKYEYKNRMEKC